MGSVSDSACRTLATSRHGKWKGQRMAQRYRVIDLRTGGIEHEVFLSGRANPEAAAREALGLSLTRSGAKRDLVAKVYWQLGTEPPKVVRLYRPATLQFVSSAGADDN
jgi:hypothetical protein